jgi:DUF3037 family protein
MADKRPFEFRILRYAPNPVQEHGANIGVILTEVRVESGFADVKLTEDWRLARFLNPSINVEMLMSVAEEIKQSLHSDVRDRSQGGEETSRREWMLHVLDDWFSNTIQVSEAKAVMTADPAAELTRLVKFYCAIVQQPGESRAAVGRKAILSAMNEAFTQSGVLGLLKRQIAISEFTRKGDRFEIDYGYRYPAEFILNLSRDDQVYRMFHAVSLANEAGTAEMLALKFQEFRNRFEEKQQARVELTVITEEDLNRDSDIVKFAHDTFHEKGVKVAAVTEMPRIAERARIELAA